LFLIQNNHAQQFSQTIRGTVTDQDSKTPLVGANVFIVGSDPVKGTVTNANGEFRLTGVHLGRISLQVSYMGYEPKNIPNILVGSGKEVILQIELKESLQKMEEVVINGTRNKGEVRNEMAIISSRSFSVEETKRYAGAFQDPSRMVSAYAGVTSDPSGNNDIVVRGNSPKGILWRMEGVEIPNPNHFANEGATGGPINALNSELLSNSDFYTGAFSPEYGDVLSGVFDMRMRSGNNEKHEYSIGVGVLGTDVTAEGPFKKNYGGSYLFNYRYSSLAMLNQLGLVDFDGVPKYQDAAFKVVLPSQKWGTLSIFALGGTSNMFHEQPESENNDRVIEKADFSAKLGVLAINHTLPTSQNSFLKLTVALSNNSSKYSVDKLDSLDNFAFNGEGEWEKSTIRTALMYSSKLNNRNRIIAGIKFNRHFYNMYEYYYNEELTRWVKGIDMSENANSYQGYISWKYRLNDNLTFVGGLHSLVYSLNNDIQIEPRLALRWQFTPKQAFNFGFGMHSKSESIVAYYTKVNTPEGMVSTPNTDMGLSKARHYVVGYEMHFSKNLNSKIDFYYQDLYNIPVENIDTSSYSILNSDEGYIDKALINSGKGYNYGIEYTLERYFDRNFYFLVTASLYNSKYKSLEGKLRNTKYNGNYAINFLIGKEFLIRNGGKANMLGVNTKFFFNGGRRYLPVNLDESKTKGYTVYDYSHAWENKLDDIIQINLAVNYRINRPKTSHEFIIDIANVANAQGRTWEYYNKYTRKIEYYKQLSFLPNIMYRVHF
jgi:hypothetical protein